jgi:DnaJ-class molecular chaperone
MLKYMDYYKLLEVEKSASQDGIKKAYRKMSLKYHPDKPTGDAEKFKEINEAYQTLGDENKRRMYDMKKNGRGGMNINFGGNMPPGFHHFNGSQGGEVPDILKMFFGGVDPMRMNGRDNTGFNPFVQVRTRLSKPTPIQKTVVITLVSSYEGIIYPVEIERTVAEDGIKRIEKETLYVDMPKGIDNNEIIILQNKGNIIGERKGDVKIHIKVNNDTKFVRKGINLHMKKDISLKEALTDFKIEFDHLNGKKYKIDHAGCSIIYPNQEMKIKDMGMEREGRKGSLIIIFNVIFPKKINEEQKEQLKNIL